jgi:NitT/TauT family transport system permease protein
VRGISVRLGSRLLQWLASLAVLYVLWRWVAMPSVSSAILVGPGKVWDYLRQSFDNGALWAMTRVTLTETLVGLALGVAIGILLAVLIALLPRLVGAVLEPFVTAVYAMPKFVLAPILFLWFGTGFVPRLTMITATIFPVVAIYLLSGIRTVDPDRVEMLRLAGARPRQVATKLLLPHATRYLITAVVYAAPHALAVAIAAELLFGTTQGIGGALSQNAQYFNAAGVLGALAVGTVISVLLMALSRRLGQYLVADPAAGGLGRA